MKKVIVDQISDCSQRAKRYRAAVSFKSFWESRTLFSKKGFGRRRQKGGNSDDKCKNQQSRGKAAFLRKMKEYNAKGADIRLLNETQFLDLIGIQKSTKKGKLDLPELVLQLRGVLDHKKIDRAIKMLKKESFQLYVDLADDKLGGIVKSQANPNNVYASYISAEGLYGCHDEELEPCWGLQGKVCKHIIVLLLGMSQNGDLDPRNAYQWADACHKKGPKNNEEIATRLLLRYKGAQLGEIDWRPNETIPEDYYAL